MSAPLHRLTGPGKRPQQHHITTYGKILLVTFVMLFGLNVALTLETAWSKVTHHQIHSACGAC